MADDRYPYPPSSDEPLTRGPGAAVLWGAFLGCSWTWVIGMIFPALLLRDFGLWGWVVFAMPNVLGAAAMGAVLYRPERSVRIVREHGVACRWFTVITVAYHLFVIGWLFSRLFGLMAAPMLVVAIGVCATIGFRNRRSAMLFVAAGVTLLSWGCFSYAAQMQGAWGLAELIRPAAESAQTRLGMTDLLLFLPCALFGFALCPYLDLTFHRARINTSPGTGVLAFVVGFCVVFFMMIVFSVCYGAQLLPFINGEADAAIPGYWLVVLAVHLTVQAGFTITVHVREVMEDERSGVGALVGVGGLAIVLGLAAQLEGLPGSPLTGVLPGGWGEAGYRGFLLLYGTVLPGYVLLVMIPPLRGQPVASAAKARRGVYALACIVGYPLGWVGFVMGQPWGIVSIFVVFTIARVAIEALPTVKGDTAAT